MGSSKKKVNQLAETLKIPGGKEIAGRLSEIIANNLNNASTFSAQPSKTANMANSRLGNLLNANYTGEKFNPTFTKPPNIDEVNINLSSQERARRKSLANTLSQSVRDAASARGLNRSEAGAKLEADTMSRFYEGLAKNDFERERILTSEQMAKESLRLESESRLFNQQIQTESIKQGRSAELFQRQVSVIDRVLNQENIKFNQDQVEFTTNLAAAGMPIDTAMQFMELAHRGDIAAAEMILQGIALDQNTKNALIDATASLFGGASQVAGTVAGMKFMEGF